MKTLTLITDFGTRDYFIGVMKGVARSIDPDIHVIDLANEIPSYNISAASFVLEKNYRYFPKGTVFLVVVDPGVGTERGILLVHHDGYYFIGPDNGVLTPVLKREEKQVWKIIKNRFFLHDGPSTFEARDKMTPVAAHLLKGVDIRQMAMPTNECIVNSAYLPQRKGDSLVGHVVYIDKFGNCITNITKNVLFFHLSSGDFRKFEATVAGNHVDRFLETYGRGGNDPFMVIGSHQNLEIAVKEGSAAEVLGVAAGQKIIVNFF
jgi:S-adenosylmethionine hydrolase